jgi:hypothetical protein
MPRPRKEAPAPPLSSKYTYFSPSPAHPADSSVATDCLPQRSDCPCFGPEKRLPRRHSQVSTLTSVRHPHTPPTARSLPTTFLVRALERGSRDALWFRASEEACALFGSRGKSASAARRFASCHRACPSLERSLNRPGAAPATLMTPARVPSECLDSKRALSRAGAHPARPLRELGARKPPVVPRRSPVVPQRRPSSRSGRPSSRSCWSDVHGFLMRKVLLIIALPCRT